jgi:hypothetical protein
MYRVLCVRRRHHQSFEDLRYKIPLLHNFDNQSEWCLLKMQINMSEIIFKAIEILTWTFLTSENAISGVFFLFFNFTTKLALKSRL